VGEEGDAGINTDPNVTVTFGDVFHVSWRAADTFAVSKWLTMVVVDGGKIGEEMASDRQYPSGMNGKFCGAKILERSGFLRLELDVIVAAPVATPDCFCCTRQRKSGATSWSCGRAEARPTGTRGVRDDITPRRVSTRAQTRSV
jgi:hypothetical protein